jgi:hypothetical protein
MRDARVLVLVAACLPPIAAHAAGKPTEGPQSAVEFFQQLFSDAPPPTPAPDAAEEAPVAEAARDDAEPPEPPREPVPFDAEEEEVDASEGDIPAVNPSFRRRFGESAAPGFPEPEASPAPGVPSDSAPPARAPVPSFRAPAADRPAADRPAAERPAADRPAPAQSRPAPAQSRPAPAQSRPALAPARPAAAPRPVPGPEAGDAYVDDEDLMDDEATLEIEEITED